MKTGLIAVTALAVGLGLSGLSANAQARDRHVEILLNFGVPVYHHAPIPIIRPHVQYHRPHHYGHHGHHGYGHQSSGHHGNGHAYGHNAHRGDRDWRDKYRRGERHEQRHERRAHRD